VKLYDFMIIKIENMIQNRFFIEKYAIFDQKMDENEISNFIMVLYLNIKNVVKMLWIRFLLQEASFYAIPQKSLTRQKFLTTRAPLEINFDHFLKSARKLSKFSAPKPKFT